MVQISGENSPPLSKDERLRDIGHNMSIGNLILGVNSVTVSYLIHYDSLLQNATIIVLQNATEVYYKMRQFYCKIRQKFITKCDSFMQNATVITKCYVYCKLRQYIRSSVLKSFELIKNDDVMPGFGISQYLAKSYSRPNGLSHLVFHAENNLMKCDANCPKYNSKGYETFVLYIYQQLQNVNT